MSEDARRLLRALVDVAMAEGQVEDEEAVVGVSTSPSLPVTEATGIEGDRYYDERLSAALSQLVDAGALEYEGTISGILGEPEAYKITRRGIELLREVGA